MSHPNIGGTREDDERLEPPPIEGRDTASTEPQPPTEPDFNEEQPDVPVRDLPPETVADPPAIDIEPPADTSSETDDGSDAATLAPRLTTSTDDEPDPPDGGEPSLAKADPPAGIVVFPPPIAQAAPETARTTCQVCGNDTEALAFCGHCGASLANQREDEGKWAGRLRRAGQRVRDAALPSAGPVASSWQLAALILLAAIAILSLIAGYVGVALMLGAALVPLLLATTMPRLDLYGSESPVLLLLAGVGGTAVGLAVGLLMGWIGESWWFDTGLLRFGAAGYGGQFAKAEGSASPQVLVLNGIVLPLVALALAVGVAYVMRRWHQFRNEAMDGMTLGAVTGAGWAIGAAVIFAWPVATTAGPTMSVQDWTLLTLGLVLFRPIILTGATAIVGTAIWQILLSQQRGARQVWALVGALSVLLLGIGTIVIQPRSLQGEILVNLGLAVIVMVALRLSLRSALTFDRRSGDGDHVPNTSRGSAPLSRPRPDSSPAPAPIPSAAHTAGEPEGTDAAPVTCPNCGKLTPPGRFCANCGESLSQE